MHLHHGPIDLIIEVFGVARAEAYERCIMAFDGLLDALVEDLPILRAPLVAKTDVSRLVSPISRRMIAAVRPFSDHFVTPMASVAGAVADHMLGVIRTDPGITKAYINNGGDIAFHLADNASLTTALAVAKTSVILGAESPVRGIATSGWRGRSHSLGIADQVTVLASTAAQADVAATLIANAVDLPEKTGILRHAASDLAPDSDLGERLVTTHVPGLVRAEKQQALQRGAARATLYRQRGLIHAAFMLLQDEFIEIGDPNLLPSEPETCDA